MKWFKILWSHIVAAILVALLLYLPLYLLWKNSAKVKGLREPQKSALADTFSEPMDTLSTEDTIRALAVAFAIQESRLNHEAVSPCGRWVGCLQISKVMVAEANRIAGGHLFFDGSEHYIDDRLDRQGSYAIFKIVQTHHNPTLNLEKATRIWAKNPPQSYVDSVKSYYQRALEDSELRKYFD